MLLGSAAEGGIEPRGMRPAALGFWGRICWPQSACRWKERHAGGMCPVGSAFKSALPGLHVRPTTTRQPQRHAGTPPGRRRAEHSVPPSQVAQVPTCRVSCCEHPVRESTVHDRSDPHLSIENQRSISITIIVDTILLLLQYSL